jgi:hypothetical protein
MAPKRTKARRIAELKIQAKDTDPAVRATAYRELLRLNVYLEGHFWEHERIQTVIDSERK